MHNCGNNNTESFLSLFFNTFVLRFLEHCNNKIFLFDIVPFICTVHSKIYFYIRQHLSRFADFIDPVYILASFQPFFFRFLLALPYFHHFLQDFDDWKMLGLPVRCLFSRTATDYNRQIYWTFWSCLLYLYSSCPVWCCVCVS